MRDRAKQYEWAKRNAERVREIRRNWYRKHAHEQRATQRAYYRANVIKAKEWRRRAYFKSVGRSPKTESEILERRLRSKLATNLRVRMYHTIKRNYKSGSAIELLGCSVESFRIYVETLFKTGMTWDNYGKHWHLDHIVPCAIFDMTRPDHQRRCFHFSNYQPLEAIENLRKGCKTNHAI